MRQLFQFPVRQFLSQRLFEAHYNPILNPSRFWNLYRIDYLERCLDREFESNSHGSIE